MSTTARSNHRRRLILQLMVAAMIILAAILRPRVESWLEETFPDAADSGKTVVADLSHGDRDLQLPRLESSTLGEPVDRPELSPSQTDRSVPAEVDDSVRRKIASPTPITVTTRSEPNSNRSGASKSRESGDDPPPGKLKLIGDNIFRSTAGVIYRPGSQQGHRLKHILDHAKDNPDKPVHGVFRGHRDEILRWIDLAFVKTAAGGNDVRNRSENQRVAWTVNMKEQIGYVGGRRGKRQACRYLRLVIEDDGKTIVTAYPTSSF